MQKMIKKSNQDVCVLYGDTLSRLLNEEKKRVHKPIIFVLTNERYYDEYYNKINQFALDPQSIHWHICSNDRHCNQYEELQMILKYFNDFSASSEITVIAIGNAGICQLAGFYANTTIEKKELILVPMDLSAFFWCITSNSQLEIAYNQPALEAELLPQRILYDITTTQEVSLEEKRNEFFSLIRFALTESHEFLRELYRIYPTSRELVKNSFGVMLPSVFKFLSTDGSGYEKFGSSFVQGIYQADNTHFLASFEKKVFASVLHLIWSQEKFSFSFHIENFITWLLNLGYTLELPEQVLITDLAEAIVHSLKNQKEFPALNEIGSCCQTACPDEAEIFAAISQFQLLVKKIKENKKNGSL